MEEGGEIVARSLFIRIILLVAITLTAQLACKAPAEFEVTSLDVRPQEVTTGNEEMDSAATEYRDGLDTISAEVVDINHRLERLYDALETGKLGLPDLAPRIQQLRRRQQQLQAKKWELEALLSNRRVELANLETVTQYVDDLRNLLNESSLTERKAFIRSFVKEVKVTGDEVLLTYTMPLPPQGISQERIGVLYSVQHSGPLWIRTTDPGLIRTVL